MPSTVTSLDNVTVCDIEFHQVLLSIQQTITVTSMDNVAVRDVKFEECSCRFKKQQYSTSITRQADVRGANRNRRAWLRVLGV